MLYTKTRLEENASELSFQHSGLSVNGADADAPLGFSTTKQRSAFAHFHALADI